MACRTIDISSSEKCTIALFWVIQVMSKDRKGVGRQIQPACNQPPTSYLFPDSLLISKHEVSILMYDIYQSKITKLVQVRC